MADLIICINLDESRKKHGLIIETYEGNIPHLKSKQYSGPLRNVDLSSVSYADNLSSAYLQVIKNVFNDSANTQISKHQYLYAVQKLPCLSNFVNEGCIFYKDRQHPMYQVEKLCLNTEKSHLSVIHDFSVLQEKTNLYINYDAEKEPVINEMQSLFYVDLSSPDYQAELFFDYGHDLIKAESKEQFINNEKKYRDYKQERDVITQIKSSHWKPHEHSSFVYDGKDISEDMRTLDISGIHLFTNERKRIKVLDFSTTNVSYGIDWFELKGEAKAGDLKFDIGDLVDFRKKKSDWTEYNGQILFVPSGLRQLNRNAIEKAGNDLRISTDDILEALEVVDYFGKGLLHDYGKLTGYQDVSLKLPEKLFNTLRDYQKIGVKWLLSLRKNGFGGCLADDMGLGKTIQVISYLSDESQNGTKALIVVPKTLIENWRREFKKFSPETPLYIYHGPNRDLKIAQSNRIIITTYGTLLNDIEIFARCGFDHLIIDEAQNIKNSKSKAYRAVARLKATTRIIMTGTPLENNIQEYWGLMKIANPTKLSYKALSADLDDSHVIAKIKRLTNPFLLRRFKKDVLDDLPERQEQIIYCDFDEAQRLLYDNLLESIKHEIDRTPDQFEIKSNSIVLSGLLYLQEVCCHPRLLPKEYNLYHCIESAKTEQLLSMLTDLYNSGHKVVVFSRFTKMLDIINREIKKLHFNVFYLDGNTQNRQKIVDDFETSQGGIFLISLKAGGVGLNLVSADSVVIYDPWWNPAVEKQAEDRIYRIGQKNKVTIYKLIASNTIEEKIQSLQETKRKLFDDVVEGHETPQSITIDDIKNLLNNNK